MEASRLRNKLLLKPYSNHIHQNKNRKHRDRANLQHSQLHNVGFLGLVVKHCFLATQSKMSLQMVKQMFPYFKTISNWLSNAEK